MCGRYYVGDDLWDRVRDDFPEVDIPDSSDMGKFAGSGDITPAMTAVSLVEGDKKKTKTKPLTWGFKGFDGKSLVINARAESLFVKPMFRESAGNKRCVLPASGFYEWDKDKQKVTFTHPYDPVIYLAGIYRPYGNENRFVIITGPANESMLPIHDRMPLMIRPEDVRSWICDPSMTEKYLVQTLPQLISEREYEQLSFLYSINHT